MTSEEMLPDQRNKILIDLHFKLSENFNELIQEEEEYNNFLKKKIPPEQHNITEKINALFDKFNEKFKNKSRNLSRIEKQIKSIATKVALKEEYIAKMRHQIVDLYESNYEQKSRNFLASCNLNPEPEYKSEFMHIRELNSGIYGKKSKNRSDGKQPQYSYIKKIIDKIEYIRDNEKKIDYKISIDFHNIDKKYDQLKLKPSPPFDDIDFSKPIVATISGLSESFAPARSSPRIGNLGMAGVAGATVIAMFAGRYFLSRIKINKEPEKKEEEMLREADINKKLSQIFDENIVFDKRNSTINFNNFSPEFCQNVGQFFKDEGLEKFVSNNSISGLTLKKLNELPAEKGKEVFDKFLQKFRDNLIEEKQKIFQQKLKDEEFAKQQESIKGLLESIESVNKKIQEIVDKENIRIEKINSASKNIKGKKPNSQNEIEEKNRYLEALKKQLEAMNKFKKEKDEIGNISDDQESFFKKKFQKFDSLITNLQSKEALTFQAVRVVARVENKIVEGDQKNFDPQPFANDDGDFAPAPNPLQAKVENGDLTMADLIKLKAIFLEEGFTKIYCKKEKKEAIQAIKIQNLRLGFLNQETLESESFEQEYQSRDNRESLLKFGKNQTDENLAKHYFHNLLEETVNDIYERKAQKTESEIDEKKLIKDNLYSFLNYAMGDMGAVLEDYKKREIDGEGRGGLTGSGHASRANLKDAEKLCLCLKMLKNGGELEHVESEQLKNFIGVELFTKKPSQESDSYLSLDVPIEKKPDDIFARDLILKLVNEDKIKGHEEFKGKIVEFFKNNAERFLEKIVEKEVSDEYSQRISQVSLTTEFEGNTLKYLSENLDIVSDIIAFANKEGLLLPTKGEGDVVIESETKSSFKDELKSVYVTMESKVREKEQRKAGAGLV